MTLRLPIRFPIAGWALAVALFAPLATHAQTATTATAATRSLLDKAHVLEVRGRMDMASQAWQQVLLSDPNNTEALGGLARAAKLSGNLALANTYLNRLRAINPNDPNISRVESMVTQQGQVQQLQQAGALAQSGQYDAAMKIYRQTFGSTPPPGDWALAYYQTEAATNDGRDHAIAGLRELINRYPNDSRYQITLGRILTYNPKTRAEGRAYLQRHPADPAAMEALRQSLIWDSANPAMAPVIKSYLAKHKDPELEAKLQQTLTQAAAAARSGVPSAADQATMQAQAEQRAANAEEAAAYSALNAKHLEEADQRFQAILAKDPNNPRALAGMGYVRMNQSNFGGAISYLSQAKQNGAKDAGIENALATSRFWYTMGDASTALNENDVATAETQYRAALAMRPSSPEALEGLGGTLLKAQQPESAIGVFDQYVRVKSSSPAAWRGLFTAQYQAGKPALALATEAKMPPAVRSVLRRDPEFLRTLASAYSAVGRDADAQRVLKSALDLPFPANGKGLKAETQLQYAGLLQQANHLDQAAGLYRQVLAADSSNADAWQGLVRVQHAMKQDGEAVRTLESMPQATYDAALRDPGFLSTIASMYQSQNQLEVAQGFLERAVTEQTTVGQKPSVPLELQLASVYLSRGNAQAAYPIYQHALASDPSNTDAWMGLLSALHQSGHDREAVAETQQIPAKVRSQLEGDVGYLQTMSSVYNSLGDSRQAMVFLNRVQQHYQAQRAAAPADVQIQNAYLLYNAENDPALYAQLMQLGGRQDLTVDQRRTVQTLWAQWAVRRSNQAQAAGNPRRALLILNAAAKAFPDNPGVSRALAVGYLRAGLPKQAETIYKTQNLSTGSEGDYNAAVGAALSAGDTKQAETWLRYGLNQYPKDSGLLSLAAKFEQARGSSGRAADYYKAALAAMPPPDPGADLALALSQLPEKAPVAKLPSPVNTDLASLLAPGSDIAAGSVGPAPPPYLPSYNNAYGQAPVVISSGAAANGGYNAPGGYPAQNSGQNPGYYTPGAQMPGSQMQTMPPAQGMQGGQQGTGQGSGRLRDYVPQAENQGGQLPDSLPPPQAYAPVAAGSSYRASYEPQAADDLPSTYAPPQSVGYYPGASSAQASGAEPGSLSPQPYGRQRSNKSNSADGASVPHYTLQATPQLGNASYDEPQARDGSQARDASQPRGGSRSAAQPSQSQDVYGAYVPYDPRVPVLHGTPVSGATSSGSGSEPLPARANAIQNDLPSDPTRGVDEAAALAYQREQIRRATEDAQRSQPESSGVSPAYAAPSAQAATRPASRSYDGPSNASYQGSMVPPDPYEIYREQEPQTTAPVSGLRAQPSQADLSQAYQNSNAPQQTDVLPTIRYVPNAPAQATTTHPDIAAARAAGARARQSKPGRSIAGRSMAGQSNPPRGQYQNSGSEQSDGGIEQNAQYSVPGPAPDGMVPQPRTDTSPSPGITPRQAAQAQQQGAGGYAAGPAIGSAADVQQNDQFSGQLGQQYQQPLASPQRGARRARSSSSSAYDNGQPQSAPLGYPAPAGQGSYPAAQQPTGPYPLGPPPTDNELMQRNLPPLRGPYDPQAAAQVPVALTPRQQAEQDLASLEASYSGWLGGTGIARYRSGTPGFDRLTDLEAPFEASGVLGKTLRATIIPRAVFLNSGINDGTSGQRLGTLPAGAASGQQLASGVSGELQLTTANFGVAAGYTPYEFLVSNITARFRWKIAGGPITIFGNREPVEETQLSYAGLRDPGTATNVYSGNIWGGVISTGGGVRADFGNERAGFFVSGDGAQLTGYHVLDNTMFEGNMGAYFLVHTFPGYGNLQIGANFFGEHFRYNELGFTYGQGGYFSPEAYFLASVPITFIGHYKTDWHYLVSGGIGVQAFQEDNAPYFPLDVPLQTANNNPFTPITTDAGFNYNINGEGSYRIADHWYVGGFLSGNNTNNYNTVTGGFFVRYLFRAQVPTVDYPTGLFPYEGFRPLRVP